MKKLLTILLAVGTIATAAVVTSNSADARRGLRWHGGEWHGRGGTWGWGGAGRGFAAAGLGAALGSALAHPYYGHGYGAPYYDYYGYGPGYNSGPGDYYYPNYEYGYGNPPY